MNSTIKNLYPGEIGVLIGPPASGKTDLLLNLAIKAAAGEPFPPLLVNQQPALRVLFITFDGMRPRWIQTRMRRMVSGLTNDEAAKRAGDNLRIGFGETEEGRQVASLCQAIERQKPSLVILDGLPSKITLAAVHGAAVAHKTAILVSHTALKLDGPEERPRGASDLMARARVVIDISDDGDLIRRLRYVKGKGDLSLYTYTLRQDPATLWHEAIEGEAE